MDDEDLFLRPKELKKEKKIAQATDRSQFKKTDLKKKQQRASLVVKGQKLRESMEEGIVIAMSSEEITVAPELSNQQTCYRCRLRGLYKNKTLELTNPIAVGDRVLFTVNNASEGIINEILSRKTVLSRSDNLSRNKEHIIAANIDCVLITTSVVEPVLRPALLDRYLIAAEQGGFSPIIVINKIDLLTKPENQSEKQLFEELQSVYAKLGIPCVAVSVSEGIGLEELKILMKDKICALSGQSGVGKSSLINALTGLTLHVRQIVGRTQKGSHTTSAVALFPLPFGGWCIDTPGIRSFGLWKLDKQDIANYFQEIYEHSKHCRFSSCTHTCEPECHVIAAVASGEISPLRYQSYITLLEEASDKHLRR